MIELKDKLKNFLNNLLPICESWIQDRDGALQFVDPNDGEEISAHYGATHIAATLILYGRMMGDAVRLQFGKDLLDSILKRWGNSKALPAFHADFNNFALCAIADAIKDSDADLYERIVAMVMSTDDSNHLTVNWLPMRWLVNKKRYEWSGDGKFLKKCKICRLEIEKATNKDGGIEDRMPKGVSFNLQYDVATVAVLQYLRCQGVQYDLQKELQFLLKAVAPDGDINYQGRGSNQIFAWGLWIYLLASSGQYEALNVALEFVAPRVQLMFEKHNMMLNEYDGAEKFLWWDYHYCSVYCAHFLFWMVLALLDYHKQPIIHKAKLQGDDTGLHIYKSGEYFIATFDGRKEYLAESGPVVNAIWSKNIGMLYKGSLGPWQGTFGKKYSNETVLRNFCGLVEIKSKESSLPVIFQRIAHRLGWRFPTKLELLFCPVEIVVSGEKLSLNYELAEDHNAFFNIPFLGLDNGDDALTVQVDGHPVQLIQAGSIRSQYGWCRLYQSRVVKGKKWEISII